MPYVERTLEAELRRHVARGRSVLLLGPRQTGKTTLLERLDARLRVSLADPRDRQRYERDPGQLAGEIEALPRGRTPPTVVLDEVQKVPTLLDVAQVCIDRKLARFVLSGSSARKLRRGGAVNLLPGRIVTLRLDPLTCEESMPSRLEDVLLHGALPAIRTVPAARDREADLDAYVTTYLEEEIRAEALARDLGAFGRFLELAGLESGNVINFRGIARELDVSHTTVANYFEILVDTLVAERIDPITESASRKKLTRSSRYLLFDLGVRRVCAREGVRLGRDRLGQLFEQFVGLELVRMARLTAPRTAVRFWRDPDGPEVDWVVDGPDALVPIEVKWTDSPTPRQARHLEVFLREYPKAKRAWVVCRAPRRVRLSKQVEAIPWQELAAVFA